jgi:CubicO group peptidase (beta-lactamase class C family)
MVNSSNRRRFVVGSLAYCAGAGVPAVSSPAPVHEVWSGFLGADDPPTLLTLRVMSGTSAELTVVGMGVLPLDRFRMVGGRVEFSTARPPINFEGQVGRGGDIVGAIHRGGENIPLTFVRGDLFTEQAMPGAQTGPITLERLKALRTAAACPAMGVAWQFTDGPAHIMVDGWRSTANRVPVRAGDRWHLGSVTKSLTATLAARLVERGLLDWTTSIGDVLGPRVPDMQAVYRSLTLLHLLCHRGGLVRDVPASAYVHLPPEQQRVAYVRTGLQEPPLGPAGANTVYSNVDYVVAGLMLELVAGAQWEELLTDQVLQPLGLREAGFGPPGTADGLDQPQGHRMGAHGLEPVRTDVPFAMAPAGRVNMALADLVRYLRAHRDRPTDFLQQPSWDKLHTPPFGGNYALGWEVSPRGVLSHGGTNGWWKSEVRVDPERGLVCAAVTNVLNANGQRALLELEDATASS